MNRTNRQRSLDRGFLRDARRALAVTAAARRVPVEFAISVAWRARVNTGSLSSQPIPPGFYVLPAPPTTRRRPAARD
jgi:hypothetical protein